MDPVDFDKMSENQKRMTARPEVAWVIIIAMVSAFLIGVFLS